MVIAWLYRTAPRLALGLNLVAMLLVAAAAAAVATHPRGSTTWLVAAFLAVFEVSLAASAWVGFRYRGRPGGRPGG